MFDYLGRLIQSSLDSSFEIVRGAHAVVLQEMERGVVSWENIEEVEKIRLLYTNKVAANSESSKSTSENKRVVCSYYNSGRCKLPADHQRDNLTFRHICMYCYRTVRKAYNHPENALKKETKGCF